MNFLDYVAQVDRAMKAPVTGDIVNIELNRLPKNWGASLLNIFFAKYEKI